jgi:hypothetical protein
LDKQAISRPALSRAGDLSAAPEQVEPFMALEALAG